MLLPGLPFPGLVGASVGGGGYTPVAVDVFDVVSYQTNTGTTSAFDITFPDLTGITPSVFMPFMSATYAAEETDTAATENGWSYGAYIGSDNAIVGHSITEVGAYRAADEAGTLAFRIDDTYYTSFTSFGSSKVTVTPSASLPQNYRGFAAGFHGAKVLNTYISAGLNPATGAGTVVTCGFQPNVVIAVSINSGTTGTSAGANYGTGSFGIYANGKQRCYVNATNGLGNANYMNILNGMAAQVNISSGSTDWLVTVGSFTSTGFTATASASVGVDDVMFIAFELDCSVDLIDFTHPTSTGDKSISGLAFQPSGIIGFGAEVTSVGGTAQNGGAQSFFAMGQTLDAIHSISQYVDSAGQNPQGQWSSSNLLMSKSGGGVQAKASLASVDEFGFTLNYTTAPASAWMNCALVIG